MVKWSDKKTKTKYKCKPSLMSLLLLTAFCWKKRTEKLAYPGSYKVVRQDNADRQTDRLKTSYKIEFFKLN